MRTNTGTESALSRMLSVLCVTLAQIHGFRLRLPLFHPEFWFGDGWGAQTRAIQLHTFHMWAHCCSLGSRMSRDINKLLFLAEQGDLAAVQSFLDKNGDVNGLGRIP